jgi:hypothetical protein
MPSRAVARQSRSQFAAARPFSFSFSDHSLLLHHWAAGEACCSSRLFLSGTAPIETHTHPDTRLRLGFDDASRDESMNLNKETRLDDDDNDDDDDDDMTPHEI